MVFTCDAPDGFTSVWNENRAGLFDDDVIDKVCKSSYPALHDALI